MGVRTVNARAHKFLRALEAHDIHSLAPNRLKAAICSFFNTDRPTQMFSFLKETNLIEPRGGLLVIKYSRLENLQKDSLGWLSMNSEEKEKERRAAGKILRRRTK